MNVAVEVVGNMIEVLHNAIDRRKPLVVMTEGPEGNVTQHRVVPQSISALYLKAECLNSKEELSISIPNLLGVRYWDEE